MKTIKPILLCSVFLCVLPFTAQAQVSEMSLYKITQLWLRCLFWCFCHYMFWQDK